MKARAKKTLLEELAEQATATALDSAEAWLPTGTSFHHSLGVSCSCELVGPCLCGCVLE